MHKNNLFYLLVCLFLLPAAVSCSTHEVDEPDSSATVSLVSARAACIQTCAGNTAYDAALRNACMESCAKVAATYPHAGEAFSSWEKCQDKINLSQGHGLNNSLAECAKPGDNVYRQQGCKDATKAFYRALNPVEVCQPVDPGYMPPGFVVVPPAQVN